MRLRRKIKMTGRSNAPVDHEAFLELGTRAEPLRGLADFDGDLRDRAFAPESYGYRKTTEREYRSYISRHTSHWFVGVAASLLVAACFTSEDGRTLSLLLAQIAIAGWAIQYPALFVYAVMTAKSRALENDAAIERLRMAHPAVETKRIARLTKLYGGDVDLIERDLEHGLADLAESLPKFDVNVSFELRGPCLLVVTDLPERSEVVGRDPARDPDHDYATGVVGFAFLLASRAFNVSPSVRYVEISGYTPGLDRILGKPRDEKVYRITFDRETLAALNPAELDPLRAMKSFRHEMTVKPRHWLERIEVDAA